ncbi:MAG: right-handed parallel beta-helix repeat-containing protein [Chloroflexota bacterium]
MQTKPVKTLITKFLHPVTALLLLTGVFGFLPLSTVHADGTVAYVVPSGITSGNCDSWANGCDLQYALGLDPLPGEIWVAAGTYYPTTGADRSATFILKNGVSIYGGFDGTEALLAERDPATNVTILSGDIGTPGNTGDNSYHVVTGSGTDSSALLAGFTITAGNANGSDPAFYGGGMYNKSGSPTLSNLIFSENTATKYGAGMYNESSSPSVTNATFSSNSAEYGAGMYNEGSSPSVTNATFSSNSAQRGAGMYSTLSSNVILTNVTFSENAASVRGGGMTVSGSSPFLTNVTFSGNTAQWGGAMHNSFGGNPTLEHVTFSGNSASTNGSAIFNYSNSNPIITNSILYGNSVDEIYNDLTIPASIPVVTYSIVQGGHSGTGNLDADPLLGALANNGGYTQTMALGTDSPAIGAGNNADCPGTDQRGVTRPQGSLCDMGAYEFIDATAPDTSIDSKPSNPSNSSSASFTFSGNDGGGSGIDSFECQLDGGGYSACTSPKSYDSLIDGGHTFQVRAIDNVNNMDATPASYTWTVDTIAPDTTIDSQPSDPNADTTPSFTFSGNDGAGSGIGSFMCQMDDSGYDPCTSPLTSPALLAGTHTFYVYAIDNASNADLSPASYTWTLDFTTTMVSSIMRAGASPTSATSVAFTVTFSADVTNVDTGDFALTTTGVSGASIAGVSGSDDTYTVTVNTGTGNGTIRLDVSAQADVEDLFGNPLGNLPYTGDESYSIIKTGTFEDVPNTYWAWRWIESFYDQKITTGCSVIPLRYCPERQVTRAEMAVFILRAKYGATYQPNPSQTGIFTDVPVAGKEWMQPWIEQLYEEGITSGCAIAPLRYCPERQVTRAEMAVFLLRAKYGAAHQPNPSQTGIFADVPVSGKAWMQPWIEELYEEGITTGCASAPLRYCPERQVTRAEMAVFIDRAFGIPPLP